MNKKLYIVFCIDTEGPLYESIEATFERLKEIFNIDIKPTKENLRKLQNKEVYLGGLENEVAKVVDPHLLSCNDTWDKIDEMLDEVMSINFRNRFLDSEGKGLIYNWHCVDHIGFLTNKRRRDMGYGNIFCHYKKKLEKHGNLDKIHWHFHPISFNREAHISATSYDNSMYEFHQIITRRIINFNWFPTVNRAGFHTIRQDSNFILDQWIPFDYSNQAQYQPDQMDQLDIKGGRFGDWKRAPKEWKPYHPSYDDYQTPGNMNRWTTKCLNIGTRLRLLTDYEISKAFELAHKEGKAILSFTNHDFRDIRKDIIDIYSRIFRIGEEFKDVKIFHCDAVEAMQRYLDYTGKNKLKLKGYLRRINQNCTVLIIENLNGEVLGSQPYLAIKLKDGRYYHDNLDELEFKKKMSYTFDRLTLKLNQVEKVKVASNDKYGNCSIIDIDLRI
jgi:hypothetical protein